MYDLWKCPRCHRHFESGDEPLVRCAYEDCGQLCEIVPDAEVVNGRWVDRTTLTPYDPKEWLIRIGQMLTTRRQRYVTDFSPEGETKYWQLLDAFFETTDLISELTVGHRFPVRV